MIEEKRLSLHSQLCKLLESNQVYYQPPVNVKMKYPAIVYELAYLNTTPAENEKYLKRVRFKVTLITQEANPVALEKLNDAKGFIFTAFYKADGLNHFSFNITM